MTWLEILHRPGTFVRLDGGTLDIGIIRPDHEDESLPSLFEETFPPFSAPRGGITYHRDA